MSLFILALALLASPANTGEVPAALKTENQKVLYSLGVALGRNISVFSLSTEELKFVTMGLKDSVLGYKAQVDLNIYGGKIDELAKDRMAVKAKTQKEKDKPYMNRATKKKGGRSFPSGLILQEIRSGTGNSPTADSTVRAHYKGTLTDGKVFDSSYERNSPADFPLTGVIPCWTEALTKMKVGGKARLICPSAIAYGDQGRPPQIPGGATLVFEVELLDIINK
jgi:FKBP-type peptidyl-prolyl cis-trans isomerase FkpA